MRAGGGRGGGRGGGGGGGAGGGRGGCVAASLRRPVVRPVACRRGCLGFVAVIDSLGRALGVRGAAWGSSPYLGWGGFAGGRWWVPLSVGRVAFGDGGGRGILGGRRAFRAFDGGLRADDARGWLALAVRLCDVDIDVIGCLASLGRLGLRLAAPEIPGAGRDARRRGCGCRLAREGAAAAYASGATRRLLFRSAVDRGSSVLSGRAFATSLGDGLWIDAVRAAPRLLTMLYRSTDRLWRCGAPWNLAPSAPSTPTGPAGPLGRHRAPSETRSPCTGRAA